MKDINSQLQRIFQSGASGERRDRAMRIALRYMDNITKQKGYQSDISAMRNAYDSDNYKEGGEKYKSAMSRQYSRNTYMGLSKG